jgi:hypothetical protein
MCQFIVQFKHLASLSSHSPGHIMLVSVMVRASSPPVFYAKCMQLSVLLKILKQQLVLPNSIPGRSVLQAPMSESSNNLSHKSANDHFSGIGNNFNLL